MPKRALAVIIAGFFTLFIAYAVRYGYGMLLPEMLPALSISKTQAGVIFSSYFIAYTIFSPLLGVLADRYDVRTLLTLFVALLGTGAFLMSYASSVLNASLFFTLAGIGHSACWVPVVALVQRWVTDRRRGMALAFTDLGSALGIVVWSSVLPAIVAAYDWRKGWVSLGVMAFLVAGLNYVSVKSPTKEQPDPQGSKQDGPSTDPFRKTYMKLFTDPKFWLIGFSYLLLSFAVLIPYTFLTTYAVEGLGAPYEHATRLIAVIGLLGIVGKLILGTLSDTLGRIRVMMTCSALLALGSLGMAYSKGLLSLTFTTAVFGLGYGAIWPVYAAAARDYFRRNVAGSVIGLWTLYLGVGSIISPILSGWAIDTTGTYMSAFLLGFAASVIAFLLLLPIPNRAYVRSINRTIKS
jgi:predicted MFS family arabinose efflux permease